MGIIETAFAVLLWLFVVVVGLWITGILLYVGFMALFAWWFRRNM